MLLNTPVQEYSVKFVELVFVSELTQKHVHIILVLLMYIPAPFVILQFIPRVWKLAH